MKHFFAEGLLVHRMFLSFVTTGVGRVMGTCVEER